MKFPEEGSSLDTATTLLAEASRASERIAKVAHGSTDPMVAGLLVIALRAVRSAELMLDADPLEQGVGDASPVIAGAIATAARIASEAELLLAVYRHDSMGVDETSRRCVYCGVGPEDRRVVALHAIGGVCETCASGLEASTAMACSLCGATGGDSEFFSMNGEEPAVCSNCRALIQRALGIDSS